MSGENEKIQMSKNKKQSSSEIANLAAATLRDSSASKIARTDAGSVLPQTNTGKRKRVELENRASKMLQSPKYSSDTKASADPSCPRLTEKLSEQTHWPSPRDTARRTAVKNAVAKEEWHPSAQWATSYTEWNPVLDACARRRIYINHA